MRPGWMLSGLVVCAALGPSVRAEYNGTVVVDKVEVRSGPSPLYYATSVLPRGTTVVVISDAAQNRDYLAIKPPADSFSWIKRSVLGPVTAQKATVQQNTRIRVGSRLDGRPPIVEWFELQKGTPVTILTMSGANDQEGTWVPIGVVAQEVRYIPMSAVQKVAPVQTTVAASPATNPSYAPLPTATAPPQPQQAYVAATPAPVPPGMQSNWTPAVQTPQSNAPAPPPSAQTWSTPPPRATSQYSYTPDSQVRLSQAQPQPQAQTYVPPQAPQYTAQTYRAPAAAPAATPTAYASTAAAAAAPPTSVQSAIGYLRVAGFRLQADNPTYAVETPQGFPLAYVSGAPGLDLHPYINRWVNVCGPAYYCGSLRTICMTANSVTLPTGR